MSKFNNYNSVAANSTISFRNSGSEQLQEVSRFAVFNNAPVEVIETVLVRNGRWHRARFFSLLALHPVRIHTIHPDSVVGVRGQILKSDIFAFDTLGFGTVLVRGTHSSFIREVCHSSYVNLQKDIW